VRALQGLQGLRTIDAPTMMAAEKGADLVLQDAAA
jgi:hypothetical protein